MKNIKAEIVAALKEAACNVTDQYPKKWINFPIVAVTEEENNIYEAAGKETKSRVRYRIDIWDKTSASAAALKVDEKIGVTGLGFYRTTCQDAPDPSGYKHKVMRYEGIIDSDNDFVEWPR